MMGGDVEMGSALLLFIPARTYSLFVYLFSAFMLLGILFIVGHWVVPAIHRSKLGVLRARGSFATGIASFLSPDWLTSNSLPPQLKRDFGSGSDSNRSGPGGSLQREQAKLKNWTHHRHRLEEQYPPSAPPQVMKTADAERQVRHHRNRHPSP